MLNSISRGKDTGLMEHSIILITSTRIIEKKDSVNHRTEIILIYVKCHPLKPGVNS